MKDKEKQITEMAKLDIEESAGFYSAFINDMRISKNKPLSTSKTIMSFDCPKNYILQAIGISKNSVVLSGKQCAEIVQDNYNIGYERGSKETAEKFANLPNSEILTVVYGYEEIKVVKLEKLQEIAEQFGVEIKE